MASEVDIANLALGHLGDTATVTSLDPPEGSAQAEHCARFYPIARDALLEMHEWRFATRRTNLAELTNESAQWLHAYARPTGCLKVIAVLDSTASDDLAANYYSGSTVLPPTASVPAPQSFECEINSSGAQVILTNQATAMVRYTKQVTDTTTFPPMFVLALSWQLASFMAGPILKGDVGAAEAKRCAQMAGVWLTKAAASDADQKHREVVHTPSWIGVR